MKKLLITICCFYFLTINAQILDSNMFPFILKNKILIENINNYCDEYNYKGKYNWYISLEHFQFSDTSFFIISYDIDIGGLVYNPPLFYFELNNRIVIVRSKLSNFITISPDYLDSLYKRISPDQYNQYKLNGEAPLQSVTESASWVLEFKNDSLIDKEICPIYCSYSYLIRKINNRSLK